MSVLLRDRMALGASARDVVVMVSREAHATSAVCGAGAVLLATVAFAAAWPSVRRAARTNPMEALRTE